MTESRTSGAFVAVASARPGTPSPAPQRRTRPPEERPSAERLEPSPPLSEPATR